MIADYVFAALETQSGFWVLYLIVTGLSMLSYKLGFARELPLLKSALIYVLLAVGCILLTFLALMMPIADILVVITVILALAYYRRRKSGGSMARRPIK